MRNLLSAPVLKELPAPCALGLIVIIATTTQSVATPPSGSPGSCVILPNHQSSAESLGQGILGNARGVCDVTQEPNGCGSCIQLCRTFTKIIDRFGCPLDEADGFCNPDYEETDPDCCGRNGQCNEACGTGSAPLDPDCTWPRTPAQPTVVPRALDFLDLNEGWLVANGSIWRTTDGGATLTRVFPDVGTFDPSAVDFINSTHGWVGERVAGRVRVIHTSDGGLTWSEQLRGANGDILSLFFLDTTTGWAGWAAGPSIFKTTDGGATWSRHAVPYGLAVGNIHFVDHLNGWTPHLRTIDGGLTWMEMPGAGSGWKAVDFVDLDYGWRVGTLGIERTTDGGLSWDVVFAGGYYFTAVDFVDRTHGRAAGLWTFYEDTGGIYRTSDGGDTWTLETRNESYVDIQMLDADNGYAIGVERPQGIPLFVRSSTSGE